MSSRLRRGSGRRPLRRLTPRPISGRATPRRRNCRASSTICRAALWVALGRVFPGLLAAEWCCVEVAPGGPHRLVAAVVDEVGTKHTLAVAEEHVVAVPFIHAEIGIEAVG